MPIEPTRLACLVDKYWSPLFAWVGARDANAEDVVQQTFIRLAAADPVPEHVAAWLFQVSRRIAINERVSQSRRRERERHRHTRQSVVQNDRLEIIDRRDGVA